MAARFLLPSLLLAACAAPGEVSDRRFMAMGTSLQVSVKAGTTEESLAATEAAVRAFASAEQRFSNWRPDSTASLLNAAPVRQVTPTDAAFRRGLALAMGFSATTQGAFDPGAGALIDLWGVRRGGVSRPPDTGRVRAAVESSSGAFRIRENGVARYHQRAKLATGGFAKGLALDDAITAVQGAGATSAMLDIGGQLRWFGKRPTDIAIAHPDHRDRAAAWLRLPKQGSLASSGNSERGLVVGGKRLSHILDPRTGRPANDFGSVTVLTTGANPGCAADCLSTAFFVLGPEEGLRLADRLPSTEVLFLVRKGDRLLAIMTAGMRSHVQRTTANMVNSDRQP